MADIKTIIHHHKNKILMGLAGVVTLGMGFALYKVVSNDKNISQEEDILGSEIRLANFIITGDKEGTVSLLNTETGGVISDLLLDKGNYIYYMNDSLDTLYAFNKDTKELFNIKEDNEKLTKNSLLKVKDDLSEVYKFVANDNFLITLSKDNKSINKIDKEGKVKAFAINDKIQNLVIVDNNVLYTTKDKIYTLDLTSNKEKNIEVGDETTGFFVLGDKIKAYNKFGSGLNKSIILTLNPKDLNIDHLHKIESANISGLKADREDDKITYNDIIVLSKNDSDYSAIQSFTTVEKDTYKISSDKTKVKRKIDEFRYDGQNTIASKGYVYSVVEDKLEIVDNRSGEVAYEYKIKGNFVSPVLK